MSGTEIEFSEDAMSTASIPFDSNKCRSPFKEHARWDKRFLQWYTPEIIKNGKLAFPRVYWDKYTGHKLCLRCRTTINTGRKQAITKHAGIRLQAAAKRHFHSPAKRLAQGKYY